MRIQLKTQTYTYTRARVAYYDNKNECEFANKATVNLAIQFESIKENGIHRKTTCQNEKWTCSVFFWELCFIVMIAAKRSDFCFVSIAMFVFGAIKSWLFRFWLNIHFCCPVETTASTPFQFQSAASVTFEHWAIHGSLAKRTIDEG